MDRLGRIHFRVEGLSMERLLNQCANEGIRLQNVRRVSVRDLRASAAPSDFAALRAFAAGRGWRVTEERSSGILHLRRISRRRMLLLCGIIVFFMMCWYASACIWFVEVRGAGAYEAEVRQILSEHGVRPGRFAAAIDTASIRRTMEERLTGLSWVGVHRDGVRLHIACVPAENVPRIEQEIRDLVAAQDGIVHTVVCQAGTPRVSPGDIVRRGDVLIEGMERGAEDLPVPVRAEGSVMARVWHTGDAYVSAAVETDLPTGAEKSCRAICTPQWRITFETPPDYAQYELETRLLPLGGALPVWLSTEIYRETQTVAEMRPTDAVCEEAAAAAMRLARENAGWELEILDKWVEYSMINKEGCRAKAVVETLQEIAAQTLSDGT